MRQRQPRLHDEAHLKFIRGLPCCVCLDNTATESAHVRMSDSRAAKVEAGIGQKPHDRWTVPLCNKHHYLQHAYGENQFWFDEHNIDPIFLALALYSVSGDQEAGETIIRAQH